MKKFFILILVLFLTNTIAFSTEKKPVPYSKNQVELNLDKEQSFVEKIKQPLQEPEQKEELNTPVGEQRVSTRKINPTNTSSEVVMTIKPFKEKRVDLDVGADQSFSEDTRPAQSQVNSAIKFRL